MKKIAEELAEELERIVKQRVFEATQAEDTHREKFEALCNEIDSARLSAQELYEDMKNNGLDVGVIEAEGFLRCAISLTERANEIKRW